MSSYQQQQSYITTNTGANTNNPGSSNQGVQTTMRNFGISYASTSTYSSNFTNPLPPPPSSSSSIINNRPVSRHGRIQRNMQVYPEDFNWLREDTDSNIHSHSNYMSTNNNANNIITARPQTNNSTSHHHQSNGSTSSTSSSPILSAAAQPMTIRGTNITIYSPLNAFNSLTSNGAPIRTTSAATTTAGTITSTVPPQERTAYTRPQFRSKVVCQLDCKYCGENVCKRGMKAILLADMAVELFSTDMPPES